MMNLLICESFKAAKRNWVRKSAMPNCYLRNEFADR
jgi:hypothetical protein